MNDTRGRLTPASCVHASSISTSSLCCRRSRSRSLGRDRGWWRPIWSEWRPYSTTTAAWPWRTIWPWCSPTHLKWVQSLMPNAADFHCALTQSVLGPTFSCSRSACCRPWSATWRWSRRTADTHSHITSTSWLLTPRKLSRWNSRWGSCSTLSDLLDL